MRLDEFDYPLPDERIAQHPVEPRDSARLLVDRGSAAPEHRRVCELVDLLGDGDLLVVNDTRVIPARLRLHRDTGGSVEVLLLEPLDSTRHEWECLVRPARKMRAGELLFADGVPAVRVDGRTEAGDTMTVTLLDDDPLALLGRIGEMPLPPYITARSAADERYQTVYANEPAAAAAPTAGLHFTPSLLDSLEGCGVATARVELVVGLDTFRPVSAADPRDHQMHSERYHVPAATLAACRDARRVVAVGTTSVRALESAATLGAADGRTRMFIHRPYEWKVVDLLMTNFHLPRTTLLMMIDAFVGPRWRRLYDVALAEGYRFLSFGDAMLLDRRAQ
ncbi:MAG: tRNA preQ1(34) S-adenosylmethionine ribosyltransferase-isomerase QueA [Ilumatobacteraceae bacterium]